MRIKNAISKILVTALVSTLVFTNVDFSSAEENVISVIEDHEYSFQLARVADDKDLSSYEEGNGAHWVKLFSNFDGVKNIYDDADVPDNTAKMKVVFDITEYDLDNPITLTWATGIGGWASGKPTGVTIDQNGTYEAVLDFESDTDGIGRTISAQDIAAASIQMVFRLGEADEEGIANVKKTTVTFKDCYTYESGDEVNQVPVVPAETEEPETTPTVEPTVEPTKTPEETTNPGGDATPSTEPTKAPAGNETAAPSTVPTNAPTAPSANPTAVQSAAPATVSAVSTATAVTQTTDAENPVKAIKAAKKKVVVKAGKAKTVKFKLTLTDAGKKTTDKVVKAATKNKKVAKVASYKLAKKALKVKVKAKKKGKTVLNVKVGKKSAKATIVVK